MQPALLISSLLGGCILDSPLFPTVLSQKQVLGIRTGQGSERKPMNFLERNSPYLNCNGGYTCIYIYQTSSNSILKNLCFLLKVSDISIKNNRLSRPLRWTELEKDLQWAIVRDQMCLFLSVPQPQERPELRLPFCFIPTPHPAPSPFR